MGLERVAAVLQGVVSNFETDLFTPLIERAADLTGLSAGKSASQQVSESAQKQVGEPAIRQVSPPADSSQSGSVSGHDFSRAENGAKKEGALAPEGIAEFTGNASLRIIADHARAATFLINDGVVPSNEGRGYVLRKILRRAIRHGRLLGQEKSFLFEMVFAVRDLMQGAYPELVDSAARVAKVVEAEEKQFDRVLKIGLTRLDEEMKAGFTGDQAFHLYETFGLPLDFMTDAARDYGHWLRPPRL